MAGRNKDKCSEDITAGCSYSMLGNFCVFAQAVSALNRIGEELYIEPYKEGLAIRTLNTSRSAYCTFFFSNTFFSNVDVTSITDSECNLCRIPMKCALTAFKCARNTEKVVLSCRLYINPRADAMLIELTQTYDIVKAYQIPFYECTNAFRNIVDKTDLPNFLAISSSELIELFSRMHYQTDEIIIIADREKVVFQNYVTSEKDKETVLKTEATIDLSNLENYDLKERAELTISYAEMQALVNFAKDYQLPVSIYFNQPGSPMIFALESDVNFTSELVLATVNFEASVFDCALAPLNVDGNSQSDPAGREESSSLALAGAGFRHPSETRPSIDTTIGHIKEDAAPDVLNINQRKLVSQSAEPSADCNIECAALASSDGVLMRYSSQDTPPNAGCSSALAEEREERTLTASTSYFRYLFNVSQPEIDDELFFQSAKVVVPDSDVE